MTKALVLGGGGPVGIGWEAGLTVGLARAGVVLAESDAVIGTSAGSVVGAQLLSGEDLADVIEPVSHPGDEVAIDTDLDRLIAIVADALSGGGGEDEMRRRLGAFALDIWTVSEDAFLARFALLKDREWPDRFACTAVDTGTGAFRVWDREASIDLDRAVASSCAVPTVAAPITIGNARYMDGGVRSSLNADLAIGHDLVLAVSCMLLELPPGFDEPILRGLVASFQAELESLRTGGAKVETIAPDEEFLEISGWGLDLMDFSRVEVAFEAGIRRGSVEAERLAAFWNTGRSQHRVGIRT
ncbi:MAG TPA: patatin-like phospholipase family protein [Acidimicrobiales bacterium]|nr:patatin-like phospholipase family protein [Acidimicrobiales bacterium]